MLIDELRILVLACGLDLSRKKMRPGKRSMMVVFGTIEKFIDRKGYAELVFPKKKW